MGSALPPEMTKRLTLHHFHQVIMTALPSHDLKDRERINVILARYLDLSTWTPAMGAMLVCGVMPSAGGREIPESASPLRDPAGRLAPHGLPDARRVLEQWTADHQADVEDGLRTEVPSEIDPLEFLSWSMERYKMTPDAMKPTWLRYWLAFAGYDQDGEVPSPAPRDIIKRAADLEDFASVVSSKMADSQGPSHPKRPDDEYVENMAKLIRSSRHCIAGLIICALRQADTPRQPGSVYMQLLAMAKENKSASLRWREVSVRPNSEPSRQDEEVLVVPSNKGGWRDYDRSTLGSYLLRYSKRLRAPDSTA